jgi:hypothetical protein
LPGSPVPGSPACTVRQPGQVNSQARIQPPCHKIPARLSQSRRVPRELGRLMPPEARRRGVPLPVQEIQGAIASQS